MPLRVYSIKRQRRFSRILERPVNTTSLLTRYRQINIFQIMDAHADRQFKFCQFVCSRGEKSFEKSGSSSCTSPLFPKLSNNFYDFKRLYTIAQCRRTLELQLLRSLAHLGSQVVDRLLLLRGAQAALLTQRVRIHFFSGERSASRRPISIRSRTLFFIVWKEFS